MPRANHWRSRETELRTAVAEGVTMIELGARYGVKTSTVNMACHRLGIKVPAAIKSARSVAIKRRQWSNPEYRDKMRVAAIKGAKARVAWCPAYLYPNHRALADKFKNDGGAAYARSVVEADWLRDLRRALRDIAAAVKPYAEEQRRQYRSFEAELERARVNGIREVLPMRAADYAFSLVGGSLS